MVDLNEIKIEFDQLHSTFMSEFKKLEEKVRQEKLLILRSPSGEEANGGLHITFEELNYWDRFKTGLNSSKSE